LDGASSRDGVLAGICELGTEREGILPTGRVRCRDTLIPPSFNPSTVHGWLADCARSHSPPGGLPHFPRPNHLRLIDVGRQCLITAPIDARYLALSYRWGQVEMFPTKRGNINDRMREEGFSTNNVRIPRTIRDAMSITLRLGEKFLWVDSVCIIQDSGEDKKEQISQMASVYGRYTRTWQNSYVPTNKIDQAMPNSQSLLCQEMMQMQVSQVQILPLEGFHTERKTSKVFEWRVACHVLLIGERRLPGSPVLGHTKRNACRKGSCSFRMLRYRFIAAIRVFARIWK
jgi:hypothetical protein